MNCLLEIIYFGLKMVKNRSVAVVAMGSIGSVTAAGPLLSGAFLEYMNERFFDGKSRFFD